MAWPSTLPIPSISGYDIETTDPTVRTDMDGGAARVRRRFTSAPDNISLRFVFSEAQMVIFRGFWDSDFRGGAAWAFVPVKDGRSAGVSSRECRPLTGSFTAALLSKSRWTVEFKVEARNA